MKSSLHSEKDSRTRFDMHFVILRCSPIKRYTSEAGSVGCNTLVVCNPSFFGSGLQIKY